MAEGSDMLAAHSVVTGIRNMRLQGKIAIIVGAGQGPGEGMGNGRATTLRFVQEGAKVLAVDRVLASAEETARMAAKRGRRMRAL